MELESGYGSVRPAPGPCSENRLPLYSWEGKPSGPDTCGPQGDAVPQRDRGSLRMLRYYYGSAGAPVRTMHVGGIN